jgi:hypothetical protein
VTRPEKGSPEWDLWIAAIEVAAYPPLNIGQKGRSRATCQVSTRQITKLRAALDACEIDWRKVKNA